MQIRVRQELTVIELEFQLAGSVLPVQYDVCFFSSIPSIYCRFLKQAGMYCPIASSSASLVLT